LRKQPRKGLPLPLLLLSLLLLLLLLLLSGQLLLSPQKRCEGAPPSLPPAVKSTM